MKRLVAEGDTSETEVTERFACDSDSRFASGFSEKGKHMTETNGIYFSPDQLQDHGPRRWLRAVAEARKMTPMEERVTTKKSSGRSAPTGWPLSWPKRKSRSAQTSAWVARTNATAHRAGCLAATARWKLDHGGQFAAMTWPHWSAFRCA